MTFGRFSRIWLPVFLWALVIFTASTDIGSSAHTSRIIRPLLKWLNPEVSDATIDTVQTIVRKGGHLSEYAILAMLLWRSRRLHAGKAWRWTLAETAAIVLACGLYACTDEFHQMFVKSRYPSPVDVLIDTCGAAAGLFLVWIWGRCIRKWQRTPENLKVAAIM